MKVLGVISARKGSSFADKHLKPLDGKPVILHTIEAALRAERLSLRVLSSDDRRLLDLAAEHGLMPIERPAELAEDNSAIEDSFRHAVAWLRDRGHSFDAVCGLQGNVVARDLSVIDRAIELLAGSDFDSVVTVKEAEQLPEWMYRLDGGRLVYLGQSRYGLPFRRQDLAGRYYLMDGAVQVIRTGVLIAQHERGVHTYMGDNIGALVQDRWHNIEIDEPFDLALAEALLRYRSASSVPTDSLASKG